MVDYLITCYSKQNARDAASNLKTKTQFDDYSKLKHITDKNKPKNEKRLKNSNEAKKN